MAKTYQNVEEMVKDLSENNKLKKDALREIKSKTLSKYLFSLRCEHGLTQAKLSKKMNCSQGTISKIENSYDNEITVKDLLEYGKALGLQLEIGYRRTNVKTVNLIKHHCFKIYDYLKELGEIAKKDETIKKGVLDFHIETVHNVVNMVINSASEINIHESVEKPKELIHISPPANETSQV